MSSILFDASQGDRFGGALDAAAKQFSKAFDSGMLPMEFVNKMKKDGKLIMGIGHRVKSVSLRHESSCCVHSVWTAAERSLNQNILWGIRGRSACC